MQTAVPDALQALMVLARSAQPTTPDGTPTVAAQLAQTAAPAQGIAQTVNDVEAALPSVMRNMQQDQLQAMLKQAMQPQAAGIEGLAAPNMQFADGGVVGFDKGGATTPAGRLLESITEAISPSERNALAAEIAKRYASAASGTGLFMPQSDAARQRAQNIMSRVGSMSVEDMRKLLAEDNYGLEGQRVRQTSPAVVPDRQAVEDRGFVPDTAPQRAPRPGTGAPAASAAPAAAPAAAATAPAVGIAQNLPAAPTLAGAVQEAQRVMPITSLDRNREAVEELKRMRAAMPDAGLATLAALEEERRVAADIKRRMDESARSRGISAWLNSTGQLGSRGRGVAAFQEAELRREQDYASLNTVRVAKMDAIRDANNARKVGDQEKYIELLNKISELERAEKQIQAQLAGASLTAATNVRSQDIGAATADADRRSRERESAADRAARAAESAANREVQKGQQVPQEIRLMEWLRDPNNKKLYTDVLNMRQGPKTRQELMEQWSKSIMLQQQFPKFDDFVMVMDAASAQTGADAGGFKVIGSRPNQ